ncbi:hypothetical protein ANCCAN_12619 [Ancylostoma caninum]|uniref:Uncharacterized protein n=1 Tax=Ancylostoma caninum TaxID=29170 RepID=A0A368GAK0_ANCCA|nr:hypothetical protein ANCCAN_12619 [Ancylostoma caninum]
MDQQWLAPLSFSLCVHFIVSFAMIYSKQLSAVFDENITLFVMCFGAVAAKMSVRLRLIPDFIFVYVCFYVRMDSVPFSVMSVTPACYVTGEKDYVIENGVFVKRNWKI